MKPKVQLGLVAAAVFASGAALACDDMKMSGGDDGYASTAPAQSVAVAASDKATPITSTKTKAQTKQKTTGKPIAPGVATMTRTGG